MRMNLIGACAAFAVVMISSTAYAASSFTFQFDDSGGGPDGTIGSPIVGSGTFFSPIDLVPGTYALDSIPGFTMSFDIGGDMFSQADIATPISEVAVLISSFGSTERLVFTENGADGDGGPFSGSLDLLNSSGDFLSFEPSFFGGNNLYSEGTLEESRIAVKASSSSSDPFGNYLAVKTSAAPEPSTWAFMTMGIGAVGLMLRRARRSGLRVENASAPS